MNSISTRMIAGLAIATLANAFSSCSPVYVAHSRPRPVIYSAPAPPPAPEPVYASVIPPAPVQTVVVTPVIPVWAPPYVYVNEVHYYYFPDYMVYYDVFAQNYWYFDGYSWVHVVSIPTTQAYYGFDPFSTYIVVMNRNTYNPWLRHSYFEQQYPRGYYKTAYAPRQTLGANVALRAYDENQSRPVFVDKRSNKEVKVKYDVRSVPQKDTGNNSVRQNTMTAKPKTESRPQNPKVGVNPRMNDKETTVQPKNKPVIQSPKGNTSQESTRPAPKFREQTNMQPKTAFPKSKEQMRPRQAVPDHKPVTPDQHINMQHETRPAPVMHKKYESKPTSGQIQSGQPKSKRK